MVKIKKTLSFLFSGFLDDPKSKTLKLLPYSKEYGFRFMDIRCIAQKKDMQKNKIGQLKIQQMAFMILAVFLFFILVSLGFLSLQYRNIKQSVESLESEKTISSLQIISDMPELNYDSLKTNCLDKDKLIIMSGSKELGKEYSKLWPVASIEVLKIYPAFNKTIQCPAPDCNYYNVFNSNAKRVKKYSTFISICEKMTKNYEKCEIGKLILGVKLLEE